MFTFPCFCYVTLLSISLLRCPSAVSYNGHSVSSYLETLEVRSFRKFWFWRVKNVAINIEIFFDSPTIWRNVSALVEISGVLLMNLV